MSSLSILTGINNPPVKRAFPIFGKPLHKPAYIRETGLFLNLPRGSADNNGVANIGGTPPPLSPNIGGKLSTLAAVDPLNKFQTSLQDAIPTSQAPFDYSYYRTAAQQNPTLYQQFLNNNSLTNPYSFTSDMWSQYGAGGDQASAKDSIKAYMSMTKDNYGWLQQQLGRAPNQYETYAASQLGRQGAYDAIMQNNTAALAPFQQLFV